jgi:hypothetical protein
MTNKVDSSTELDCLVGARSGVAMEGLVFPSRVLWVTYA